MKEFTTPIIQAFRLLDAKRKFIVAVDTVAVVLLTAWVSVSWYQYLNILCIILAIMLMLHACSMLDHAQMLA